MSNNWKTEKIFSSYKEALELKKTLQHEPQGATLQFKIKKYIELDGKEIFHVKSRTDPSLVAVIQEIEEQLLINKNKKKKGEK